MRRSEEIYCGAPVLGLGSAYCAVHWNRAYLAPASPGFEHRRAEAIELTAGQRHRFIVLRRAGLSFARAVDLAIRPPASLLLPRNPLVPRRLAA
jgi:hypothetical protein